MQFQKKPENIILFDWLSITSKIHSVKDIKSLLGLQDVEWQTLKGVRGYLVREYFEGISIHHGNTGNVWLEMSGKGCRAFESFGHAEYSIIFDVVKACHEYINVTRLDIAFDDHTKLLNIDKICNDVRKQEYISRSREWEVIESSKGKSITVGSHASPVLVRVYDKAAERNLNDGSHWIRVEMQLRDERAFEFINQLDVYYLGNLFRGVLSNYLRFVVEDKTETNRSRLKTKPYWNKLLESAEAISLFTKAGLEYNLERLDNYVFNQAGNAIDAAIAIHGIVGFHNMIEERTTKRNPKYKEVVYENRLRAPLDSLIDDYLKRN